MNFKTYLTYIGHIREVLASGRTSDTAKYLQLLESDMQYDYEQEQRAQEDRAEILEKLRAKTTEAGGEISVSNFSWDEQS